MLKLLYTIFVGLMQQIWEVWNLLNFKITHVKITKPYRINGRLYIRGQGAITIGKNFKASSGSRNNPIGGDTILRIVSGLNAKIIIGENVGISNSTIFAKESITIGNNVMIGGSCRIWDSDFHSLDPIIRTSGNDTDIKTLPIVINDYAFIGAGSIILKGVTVGKNSIIAAGSIVSKSIPDNEIWGGNPAQFIRRLQNTQHG
nr:acyltransferase [uncultured Draconibacterium sp.]